MFEKGAQLRDLTSTSHAANLLMRGAGTPPDYEAALRMFRRSKVIELMLLLLLLLVVLTQHHWRLQGSGLCNVVFSPCWYCWILLVVVQLLC